MPGNTRVIIIFKFFVSTMTRLILVRHGETIENEQHIMQGQTQGTLNATGQRQARELRESLKAEKIDIYMSSDLARAEYHIALLRGLFISYSISSFLLFMT